MEVQWKFTDPGLQLEQEVQQFIQKWQNNAFFEIKSSGTTGIPQLFQFSRAQLILSAQNSIDAFGLGAQTKALLCLPISSIGGLMLLARALVGDFQLIIQAASARPLANLEDQIDFIALVPTQLQQSLQHDLQKLKSIKQILVGGGQLSTELIQACKDAGLNVWLSYGMTETLSHVALQKISPITATYFTALPGVHFSSKNNCLVIHYPQLQHQPLYTKDLVELHSSTTFRWLGRADHAINSGGFKIIPELLEQKLAGHFQNPFFTAGLLDEKWGQIVVIVFEGFIPSAYLHFDGLGLTTAEIPKKYACVPVFKRTSTHKIQRKEILLSLTDADWQSI
jgi:O-succinylbenzoic acid--CoA ligase